MKLAAAQIKSHENVVNKNLELHYRFIEIASDNGADLITFPEMSITGYHREGADKSAFTMDDSRLDLLQKQSGDKNIIIVAGAPILIKSDLYIGSFIIKPDGTLAIYTKQYLHSGENDFFKSSFDYNPVIELENEKIVFAICADIDNPLHPEAAAKKGCTIYIPNIFFSSTGILGAHESMSGYAKEYSMNILLSNFCAESCGGCMPGVEVHFGHQMED
jgi:predicted amidohydrolase